MLQENLLQVVKLVACWQLLQAKAHQKNGSLLYFWADREILVKRQFPI